MRSLRVVSAALLMAAALPSVNAQNAFSHRVDIKLPPGANGMQPSLALVYSPDAGNGLLGMGWSLAGLSEITRINYGEGIKFAGSDTYAHSVLGVLVKQADGSYRSKKESFARVTRSSTSCGDAPCSWKVVDRSGMTYNYATTGDSVLRRSATDASVRTWALSSVVDLFGNSYEVAYSKDQPNGRLYPSVVTYTKGPGLSAYRTVELAYETRQDVEAGYAPGALERTTQRLKWIQVKSSGALVRKYRLDYSYGASTRRSHLVAVQEYGTNGNDSACAVVPPPTTCALPAQRFGWQDGAPASSGHDWTWNNGAVSSPTYGTAGPTALVWLTGDVNGDGRTDLIQPWDNGLGGVGMSVHRSSGGGLEWSWNSSRMYSSSYGYAGNSALAWLTGDVDGDGRTDVIQPWNNGIGGLGLSVYRSNGAGLEWSWNNSRMYSSTYGYVGPSALAWLTGDVDGDGRTDVIQPWNNGINGLGISVHRSNGTGFDWSWNNSRMYSSTYGYAGPSAITWLTGDVNGDGKTDLIQVWNNGIGGVGISVYQSNGTGFDWTWNSSRMYSPTYGYAGSAATLRWLTGDVNGDGKTDLIQVWNNGSAGVGMSVFQSNGTGLDWTWNNSRMSSPTYGDAGPGALSWLTADVNGDGKTDVVEIWDNGHNGVGWSVFQSNGSGIDWTWNNSGVYSSTYGSAGPGALAWLPGDLNGDGKTDVVQVWRNAAGGLGLGAFTASGTTPDLMTRVENGLGGTVSVAYAPAPQVSGAIRPDSTGPGIPNASPRPLVTRVTTADGRGGVYASSYVHRDGRLLSGVTSVRRNLGFASVDAVDEQTGQINRTQYSQAVGSETAATQVDALDTLGRLVSRTTNTYEIVWPATGTELARLAVQATARYERGQLAFTEQTSFAYDTYGNVTVKTQSADGLPIVVVSATYANDPATWILGRLTEAKTASGGVTLSWMQNTWTSHCVTAKREWLDTTNTWLTTTASCDANGNVQSLTAPSTGDGLVRRTTTEWDPTFRASPWRTTNALLHVTLRTVNADGEVATATDANGNVTTTEYDVFGRRTKETRPDGGTTEFRYVSYGSPTGQYFEAVTRLDATRTTWKREYFDGAGFKYETRTSSDCGTHAAVITEKDAAGRPYRSSQPFCAGATPLWSTVTYDEISRPVSTLLPDGKTIQFAYGTNYTAETDQNGRTTTKYQDARRRTTRITDPAKGNLYYGYDPVGRLSSATEPSGAVTRFTYDSLSRKTSTTDPRLGVTTNTFDAAGNTLSVTSGGKTTRFTYDALNRVLTKLPQGETGIGYAYDENYVANGLGRLTSVVDAAGTTRQSYEASGAIRAMTRTVDGASFTQAFTYDLAGHPKRITYPDGSYVDYVYTNAGNLQTLSLDGALFATWSNYDAAGKPLNVRYGNGVTTAYGYDVAGHLTTLSTVRGATVLQNLAYDWYSRPNTGGLAVGAITDRRASTLMGGLNTSETQSYDYDDLYRLTGAHGVWGDKVYAYDAGGNLTSYGGLTARALTYSGQQVVSGTGLSGVTYDTAGNMTHKVLDGTGWDYTWTAEGALATASRNGALTARMTYDAGGERVRKVFTPATGRAVTTTYIGQIYEKRTFSDGRPETRTLHLFAHGMLIASVTKTGAVITASNDRNGWRVQTAMGALYDPTTPRGLAMKSLHAVAAVSVHPLVRRWFVPAILAVLALIITAIFARALARQIFARRLTPGVRFAALAALLAFGATACSNGGRSLGTDPLLTGDTTKGPPAGTSFYHRNQVNSSTVITDAAGNETTRVVYLPFGEISQANSVGLDTVTTKFTGQELDEETGLYYYGARHYDPALGRFLSADSEIPAITDSQAFNRYGYARNNPILYTDPTGHSWKVFRIVATVVLFAAAIVLTAIAPPIGAPILIGLTLGVLAGSYSAYQAAGGWDWDAISKGMLVGAVVGGLAGVATGPLGIGGMSLGGFWGSVATGAMTGAVNGFAMGVATGYQGGAEGWEKTFWQTVAVGTLAGAATGALFGGLKFSMGKESMEWPSTKDLLKIKLTGSPGTQGGGFSILGLAKGVFVGLSTYAENLAQNAGCYLLAQPVTGLAASALVSGAAASYSLHPFPIPDFKVTKTWKFEPADWFGSN